MDRTNGIGRKTGSRVDAAMGTNTLEVMLSDPVSDPVSWKFLIKCGGK
jgi:hypothetical protein